MTYLQDTSLVIKNKNQYNICYLLVNSVWKKYFYHHIYYQANSLPNSL